MSILTQPARELFEKHVLNTKLHRKVGKELLSKWNIPLSVTNDLLTLRCDPKAESDYILYHVMYALEKSAIPKGYPPKHLIDELNQQYVNEQIKFPLSYNMIQIDNDQWIGKTSARELFKLANSTLINYNENAQRLMKRIVSPFGEHYEYQTNASAIDAIYDLLIKHRYIPNTITLNIPLDDYNDVYYDEHDKVLIIRKLKMFDILDGYHRLRAFIRACAFNQGFDSPMELRITNYDDDRARQFIYQDFQRTNITKADANSLNIYSASNIIVKKIQSNPMFGNLVSYNKGIIGSSILSHAISIIYKINPAKTYKNSDIDKIYKEIINGFETFQESDELIFDKVLSKEQIYCLIFLIEQDVLDIKEYRKLYREVCDLQLFAKHQLRNTEVKKLNELLRGDADK